jgi:hypothetical protein
MIILVIVLVVVLGIVGSIMSARAARERRETLGAWAAARGWTFDPEEDDGQEREFPQFELFHRGSSRRAYNSMRGSVVIGGRDFPIKCGDYRYTVSNGKSSTTHRLSYIVVTLPFAGVPGLDIRRENLMDKIVGALGFQDINFESAEFSRRFFVKCDDRKFAYDVITPKMMDFLLAGNPPPISISRGQICLTDRDDFTKHCWDTVTFDQHLGWAQEFLGLWPEFVLKELDGQEARA